MSCLTNGAQTDAVLSLSVEIFLPERIVLCICCRGRIPLNINPVDVEQNVVFKTVEDCKIAQGTLIGREFAVLTYKGEDSVIPRRSKKLKLQ